MAIFPLPDKPIIDSYGNIEGYESKNPGARGLPGMYGMIILNMDFVTFIEEGLWNGLCD